MNRRKWSMSGSLKVLLCVFWLFAIILPLIRMLSTMATVDVRAVISARKFSKALQQSLKASCTATLISVSLAGVLSWAVARTNVRHKTILNTLITVPMPRGPFRRKPTKVTTARSATLMAPMGTLGIFWFRPTSRLYP